MDFLLSRSRRRRSSPLAISPDSAPGAEALPIDVLNHGADDDHALDHLLIVSVDPQEGEAGGDRPEYQHADRRAEDRAAAAIERCAPDDRHRDRIELVTKPHAGLSRQVP